MNRFDFTQYDANTNATRHVLVFFYQNGKNVCAPSEICHCQ